jgi:hypothetical protein
MSPQTSTQVSPNVVRDAFSPKTLTHLQRLESESIYIMREVVATADNPVMLYSIGKDSWLSSPFGGDSSVRERDLDAGAAEVDHRDQRVGGVESVGAV